MRLNLGCGSRLMDDAVNVDRVELPGMRFGTDVVWDLDQVPWPWQDNTVEAIHARDVFEHVHNAVSFMTECHRILIPGCSLWIRTPNIALNLADAFTDPTHRRFPTWQTFDYWIAGTRYYEEHNAAYGGVTFVLQDRSPDEGSMLVVLGKLPGKL